MSITVNVLPDQEEVTFNSKLCTVLVDNVAVLETTLDDAYAAMNSAAANFLDSAAFRVFRQAVHAAIEAEVNP